MKVGAESYGHAVILNLKGELTEDSLKVFDDAVNHHLAGKEVIDLVLNMEEVPFIDGTLLEYMLDLQERLSERLGQVKLVKCDENIRKILEITRLDSTFETYADMSEAVQAIGAQ